MHSIDSWQISVMRSNFARFLESSNPSGSIHLFVSQEYVFCLQRAGILWMQVGLEHPPLIKFSSRDQWKASLVFRI